VSGSQWFVLASFVALVSAALYLMFQVASGIRLKDQAARRGRPVPAVIYSLTSAMLPWKKESARLHLPAYTLGVVYHAGGFMSFFWLVVLFVDASLPRVVTTASVGLLSAGVACGFALLIRRIANPKLRHFSTPDDYFSNLLVTGFQALTAAALAYQSLVPGLFVYAGALMLYIPLGKLRHAVYFGFARIYLGIFYGHRGVWPARDRES
jgi:hypothetical protein